MQRNLDEINKIKVSYLKNNTFKRYAVEAVRIEAEKNHDGYDLIYENLLFTRHRINKASINWLCNENKVKNNKCPGSITVSTEDTIVKFTDHDLTMSHKPITILLFEAITFKHKVQEQVVANPTKPCLLLNEELKLEAVNNSGSTMDDIIKIIPSFDNISLNVSILNLIIEQILQALSLKKTQKKMILILMAKIHQL